MRRKERKLVVTFASTADAMAVEAAAEGGGILGRIIPVPSEVSAGCGLAWCVGADCREQVLGALEARELAYEGIFEVMMY